MLQRGFDGMRDSKRHDGHRCRRACESTTREGRHDVLGTALAGTPGHGHGCERGVAGDSKMSGSAAAAAAAAAEAVVRAMRCVGEIRGHHSSTSELRYGFDLESRVGPNGWCGMPCVCGGGMWHGLSRRKQRGERHPPKD
jgi:hypothetical protein